MEILSSLAKEHKNMVIASIHQPRASIVSLFDEISLLSEGKVIYSGNTVDMIPYFKKIGYPCPNNINFIEYYIDLVSIDYSSIKDEIDSKKRVENLAEIFHLHYIPPISSKFSIKDIQTTQNHSKFGLKIIGNSIKSFVSKFSILFQRSFNQIIRDKPLNIARFMSSLFSSLLFGVIYYKLSLKSSTIADRLGLLQVAAINCAMSSLIKATTSFVTEKYIIKHERNKKLYDIEPYFLSKLLAEGPISAIFPCISGTIIYLLCGLNPSPGRLLNFLGILVIESLAATSLGWSVGSLASTGMI